LIVYAYWAPSPQPSRRATCQPIIATAGARSAGIGILLPVYDRPTLRILFQRYAGNNADLSEPYGMINRTSCDWSTAAR